ncbi:MAG: AbrB family transcriptional regulator [Hyphomicrobiales bacterium]|nr:AbrB family transcriptional regulator [Hyphomicrobiales bacterium]
MKLSVRRLLPPGTNLKAMLATLALACVGGVGGNLIGMPLPWLLGPMIVICAVAMGGLKLFGSPPQWPEASRAVFIPVLGVMIGGAFTMDLVLGIVGWWPSALGLALFLLVAHWCVFFLYRRLGGYDAATAFYAAAPGGFVESIILGGAAGANTGIIAAQHFSRILIAVFVIPIGFSLALGEVVGSAAGVTLDRGGGSLTLVDALILILAGFAGVIVGRWLRLPAPLFSGPVLVSAAVHVAGLTAATPPTLLVNLTQLIVGTTLGVRSVGLSGRDTLRAFALSGLGMAVMLTIACGFAAVLRNYSDASFAALILAFSPGGLVEMSLIALSLGLSVPFVSVHHILRILFALTVVPLQFERVVKPRFGKKGG